MFSLYNPAQPGCWSLHGGRQGHQADGGDPHWEPGHCGALHQVRPATLHSMLHQVKRSANMETLQNKLTSQYLQKLNLKSQEYQAIHHCNCLWLKVLCCRKLRYLLSQVLLSSVLSRLSSAQSSQRGMWDVCQSWLELPRSHFSRSDHSHSHTGSEENKPGCLQKIYEAWGPQW